MDSATRQVAGVASPPRTARLTATGADWHVLSAADRNGDGRPDFLFQHDDGTLAVWFMDGIRLKDAKVLNPAKAGGTWKVVAPK